MEVYVNGTLTAEGAISSKGWPEVHAFVFFHYTGDKVLVSSLP